VWNRYNLPRTGYKNNRFKIKMGRKFHKSKYRAKLCYVLRIRIIILFLIAVSFRIWYNTFPAVSLAEKLHMLQCSAVLVLRSLLVFLDASSECSLFRTKDQTYSQSSKLSRGHSQDLSTSVEATKGEKNWNVKTRILVLVNMFYKITFSLIVTKHLR
jgi:hypothetical protein